MLFFVPTSPAPSPWIAKKKRASRGCSGCRWRSPAPRSPSPRRSWRPPAADHGHGSDWDEITMVSSENHGKTMGTPMGKWRCSWYNSELGDFFWLIYGKSMDNIWVCLIFTWYYPLLSSNMAWERYIIYSLYGYSTAKEKWTTLPFLYMSDEPYSVSKCDGYAQWSADWKIKKS